VSSLVEVKSRWFTGFTCPYIGKMIVGAVRQRARGLPDVLLLTVAAGDQVYDVGCFTGDVTFDRV
jgi:hypothetical protein